MMDPYQILGIDRNASDEEIKKAYRAASRKYHPDANLDNPQAAEAKFKEVQQAYQQIMKERTQGYGSSQSTGGYGQSYGGSGSYDANGSYGSHGQGNGYGSYGEDPFGSFFGGFGGFGQGYGGQSQKAESAENDDPHLKAAANYINSGYYQEAVNVLNDIVQRSAKWYYFSALANSGAGNNVIALQHATQAAAMEPSNLQYRQLKQTLEGGGQWYEQQSTAYGRPDFSGGDMCLKLCMLNLMCNCCCGSGGMCCGNPYTMYH